MRKRLASPDGKVGAGYYCTTRVQHRAFHRCLSLAKSRPTFLPMLDDLHRTFLLRPG